jgi:arylsulfatase A-like enzyme
MPDAAARPKNVLLIVVDQWRADCLSYLGHPCLRTPNLDALCADGVTFRNHFTQAVPCGPGRASLHTGLYMMMLSWRLHHADRTLTGWSASPEGLVDRSAA